MEAKALEIAQPQKPFLPRNETNASLLVAVAPHKQVLVKFRDLCAYVPVLVTPGAGSPGPAQDGKPKKAGQAFLDKLPVVNSDTAKDAPKERQVLFNVTGNVAPGQILALMGPSGSGKSSLLSVLGGRSKARLSGSLLFNGKPLDKPMKRNMGFVTQDDLLYAELTAFETLFYAALLRLPRHWPKQQKIERVEMVLEGLGLSKCRDTIIGNHMMRGVSGGERKRVSIGHELLINPSVIFLDEPTSGLDSTTALKLIHTLRSLASGGRTIIASIHQPSSRLYQEIDQLMLLSEGYVMYYGEAHASASWFALHGVPVPFGVSIPDHLLDLACGDLPGMHPSASQATMQRLLQAFEHRSFGKGAYGVQPTDFSELASATSGAKAAHLPAPILVTAHNEGDGTSIDEPNSSASSRGTVAEQEQAQVKVVIDGDKSAEEETEAMAIRSNGTIPAAAEEPADDKWGATWTQQVSILTSRCVRVRRFQALSIQRFCEVLVVAVLAGLFWFQVGGKDMLTRSRINDINGLLFFQCLFMSFSSMFQAIFAFPGDFQMLIKERQSGMYRLTAYYAARTLSDIPMDALVPSLFVIVIYWMAGLRLSAGAFFSNWFGMLLTMFVAQSFGLLIGATIMNPKTALAFSTIFMLTIMLVGGYYVQNIPIWIRWLRYVSFIYYGFNLLLKIEYRHRGYSCADYYLANPSAPPGLTWCPISGSDVIAVDVDKPVTLEACVLIGFLLVVRVAVYMALKQKTTFKSKKVKAA